MFTDNVMITYGFSFTRWECSSIVVETYCGGLDASLLLCLAPSLRSLQIHNPRCSVVQQDAAWSYSYIKQRHATVSQMRQMRADSVMEPFAAGKGFAHKGPLDKPHLQAIVSLQCYTLVHAHNLFANQPTDPGKHNMILVPSPLHPQRHVPPGRTHTQTKQRRPCPM